MRILSALLLSGTLALGACGNAPSKADCEKLLDHLIDLEVKSGGGDGEMSDDMKADLEKQRKAVVAFGNDQGFISTCTQKTPKKVVECGLAAKDTCELQACDQKMTADEMETCKKDLGK
jgi:hypothetical protein